MPQLLEMEDSLEMVCRCMYKKGCMFDLKMLLLMFSCAQLEYKIA